MPGKKQETASLTDPLRPDLLFCTAIHKKKSRMVVASAIANEKFAENDNARNAAAQAHFLQPAVISPASRSIMIFAMTARDAGSTAIYRLSPRAATR